MYFALGFLVAGLIFLMFLPAFWRRATRLSMRRLQMLMPLSLEEVVAERDLLRAEFAVRERRLEQEMDAVRAEKALDLAAIGRHAARIAQLEGDLKKAEAANRDKDMELRETQKVLSERTELLSSTELALHEMTERAERGVARLRVLESDKEELGRLTETHLTRVAAHEAKIGALHEEATQLQRDLDALREEHARVSAIADRATGLEADLVRVVRELEASRAERASLSDSLRESRAQFAELQEKRKNEIERLETALRSARDEARNVAEKLEAARADGAMLQGVVEALRAERAQQRRGNGAQGLSVVAPSPSDADVAALREAVIDFGERVAQLQNGESAKQRAR
jgi:chromosome segregation ATPase